MENSLILDVFWLTLAAFIAIATVLGRNKLRKQMLRLKEKRVQLVERNETFANYSKLASVRLAEGEAQRDDYIRQIAELKAGVESSVMRSLTADTGASVYYVFDRVAGRRGGIWAVHVECTQEDGPWLGSRAYLVVAETSEEARGRVSDRFPQKSSFSVSQPESKSF